MVAVVPAAKRTFQEIWRETRFDDLAEIDSALSGASALLLGSQQDEQMEL
jgi:hypothetical protein